MTALSDIAARRLPPTRNQIRWAEDEWKKIADIVFAMRRNQPACAIVTLVKQAQAQLPADRRRANLSIAHIGPLLDLLKAKEDELRAKAERCQELEQKAQQRAEPSLTPELIASLADDDLRKLLPRVLAVVTTADLLSTFAAEDLLAEIDTAELVGLAARRAFQDMSAKPAAAVAPQSSERTTSGPLTSIGQVTPLPVARKQRIAVVGTKGQQPQIIRDAVPGVDLIFFDADRLAREQVPTSVNYVIMWAKFISHRHQQIIRSAVDPAKIVNHHGGVETLINRIRQLTAA